VYQNPQLQLDALATEDCLGVYTDRASGTTADRAQWNLCLADLRAGDTLIIWRIDRLGRNLRDLIDIVTPLQARGVGVRSLTNGLEPKGRSEPRIRTAPSCADPTPRCAGAHPTRGRSWTEGRTQAPVRAAEPHATATAQPPYVPPDADAPHLHNHDNRTRSEVPSRHHEQIVIPRKGVTVAGVGSLKPAVPRQIWTSR